MYLPYKVCMKSITEMLSHAKVISFVLIVAFIMAQVVQATEVGKNLLILDCNIGQSLYIRMKNPL